MKNLVSTTAHVSIDRGRKNDLDVLHLFVGEEMQWRIFFVVTKRTSLFSGILFVGLYNLSLYTQKLS
jgi:hypothetical protein